MTEITITGNVGHEPVVKSTPKGTVLEFRLAHNQRRQVDGRWVDAGTTWYTVSVWDRLGANAAGSLRKGDPVIVRGELKVDEWTGQDGGARTTLKLRAASLGHDLAHGVSSFTRSAGERAAAPAPTSPPEALPVPAPAAAAPAPAVATPRPAGDWNSALALPDDVPF